MELTRVQREVLAAIIKITSEDRCPPGQSRVMEWMGRDVRGTIRELKLLGALRQPYNRSALIPTYNADGTPLELRLVEVPQQAAS